MKVLIIYNKIWPYRERIFEIINKEFDLTVAYSDQNYKDKSYTFNTLYLPVIKLGPFEVHKDNLFKISSNYDVVIGISNLRWLSLVALAFKKRSFRLGYWGIGVTASYKNKFASKSKWDKIRFLLAKKSDFTIFYSSFPLERYLDAGVPKEKLYVANNTSAVFPLKNFNYINKKDFLFIGTLYPQKGLKELLIAYNDIFISLRENIVPNLIIVGDGPEKLNILKFINEKGLNEKVILLGSIFDAKIIGELFSQAIACISPNQAGLSVLTSMGNRTIYVTKEDAITGGEIFNIKHKENGLLYKNDDELKDILRWIIANKELVAIMSENAYNHYTNNRTPHMMADVIIKAIKN